MDLETLTRLRFWFQRILVPCVVVIGVIGNFVSIVVLTRKRMRCSTNIYLTALAVADIFYLTFVYILSMEHSPNIHSAKNRFYWSTYGLQHWFCDAASYTSIYLTVSFTIERYIAVCYPIRGQVLCTESRAKRVIAGVIIVCCLMTVTTAFEYKLVNYYEFRDKYTNELCTPAAGNLSLAYTHPDDSFVPIVPDDSGFAGLRGENLRDEIENNTERAFVDPCEEVAYIRASSSDLGTNEHYRYIFYISTSIVVTFIPLCLLTTFNCFLILAVHRSYKMRHTMTNTRQSDTTTAQENKVTITLIAVVVLFLVCQTPAAIMLLYSMFTDYDSYLIKAAGNICNFLVTVNAACNFMLYCALSAKYRKTVKQIFLGSRHRTHQRQNTISTSYLSRYGTSQTSGTSLYNKSPSSFRGRGGSSGGAGGGAGGAVRNRTNSTASNAGGRVGLMPRSSSANRFTISPTDYANFQAEMARQQLKTQQLAASDFDPNHNRSNAIPMSSLSPVHHPTRLLHNTPNDQYIPRSSSLVFPVSTKHSPDCKDYPSNL